MIVLTSFIIRYVIIICIRQLFYTLIRNITQVCLIENAYNELAEMTEKKIHPKSKEVVHGTLISKEVNKTKQIFYC